MVQVSFVCIEQNLDRKHFPCHCCPSTAATWHFLHFVHTWATNSLFQWRKCSVEPGLFFHVSLREQCLEGSNPLTEDQDGNVNECGNSFVISKMSRNDHHPRFTNAESVCRLLTALVITTHAAEGLPVEQRLQNLAPRKNYHCGFGGGGRAWFLFLPFLHRCHTQTDPRQTFLS